MQDNQQKEKSAWLQILLMMLNTVPTIEVAEVSIYTAHPHHRCAALMLQQEPATDMDGVEEFINKKAELSQRRPRDALNGALINFESPDYTHGCFSRSL